eukprot:TRINITY_DN94613_c0_g1_i1.p1 TRINITY_DN94613_c0_g1~~TRINITY_DN94613_c0_g1_i1.p1  ORF type:complete len:672 (+),score=77.86 TRINITY_DN94613_c0_g1_i1:97-2016(+)
MQKVSASSALPEGEQGEQGLVSTFAEQVRVALDEAFRGEIPEHLEKKIASCIKKAESCSSPRSRAAFGNLISPRSRAAGGSSGAMSPTSSGNAADFFNRMLEDVQARQGLVRERGRLNGPPAETTLASRQASEYEILSPRHRGPGRSMPRSAASSPLQSPRSSSQGLAMGDAQQSLTAQRAALRISSLEDVSPSSFSESNQTSTAKLDVEKTSLADTFAEQVRCALRETYRDQIPAHVEETAAHFGIQNVGDRFSSGGTSASRKPSSRSPSRSRKADDFFNRMFEDIQARQGLVRERSRLNGAPLEISIGSSCVSVPATPSSGHKRVSSSSSMSRTSSPRASPGASPATTSPLLSPRSKSLPPEDKHKLQRMLHRLRPKNVARAHQKNEKPVSDLSAQLPQRAPDGPPVEDEDETRKELESSKRQLALLLLGADLLKKKIAESELASSEPAPERGCANLSESPPSPEAPKLLAKSQRATFSGHLSSNTAFVSSGRCSSAASQYSLFSSGRCTPAMQQPTEKTICRAESPSMNPRHSIGHLGSSYSRIGSRQVIGLDAADAFVRSGLSLSGTVADRSPSLQKRMVYAAPTLACTARGGTPLPCRPVTSPPANFSNQAQVVLRPSLYPQKIHFVQSETAVG